MRIAMMLSAALIALAACGDKAATNTSDAAAPTARAGAAGWNALDACATVGTDAVARATSQSVSSSQLGPVKAPENGLAGSSMCTFKLADAASMSVLTREAPDDDATPEAIAQVRDGVAGMTGPATAVPGIGQAAFWGDKPPALQVFIDGRRYATVSVFKTNGLPDASAEARAAATAIARKLAR